jgi:hypothetical protein
VTTRSERKGVGSGLGESRVPIWTCGHRLGGSRRWREAAARFASALDPVLAAHVHAHAHAHAHAHVGRPISRAMEGWTKIQSSFSNINFGAVGTNLQNNLSNVGQNAGKLTKGLNSTIQATKGTPARR